MSSMDNQSMLSAYGRLKSSIERKEGDVVGYDSQARSSCIKKYQECEFQFSDFSHTDFTDVEKNLHTVSNLVPFAIGLQDMKLRDTFVKLYVKQGNIAVLIGSILKLPIEKILTFCEQSPYGDLVNQETKIDLSVREANEISSDRLIFKETFIGIYEDDNIRQRMINEWESNEESFVIEEAVGPDTTPGEDLYTIEAVQECVVRYLIGKDKNGKVELVFHKLNIYSENGHFKPHTDTPTHDPALFIGTVVVCLPSEHTGGDLIVRHHNDSIRFNFADNSGDTDNIQFAAFYGDCEHEVLPVTSGHRVTLTFSILRHSDDYENYTECEEFKDLIISKVPTESLPNALAAAYTAIEILMDQPHFGLFLGHSYTESGLTAEGLKGADKLFYDYFVAKGVAVSLVTVVADLDYYDVHCCDFQYGNDVADLDQRNFIVRLIKVLTDTRSELHKELPPNISFLTPWAGRGETIKNGRECVQGYAGNQVEVESVQRMYLKSAMIVGPFPGIPAEGRVTGATTILNAKPPRNRGPGLGKYGW